LSEWNDRIEDRIVRDGRDFWKKSKRGLDLPAEKVLNISGMTRKFLGFQA
jgi:hypothetical protein